MMQIIFSWIIGSVLGSFVTCWCDRQISGRSILSGRSHCEACGQVVRRRDLIPIVSYIRLKGRCRACGAPIGGVCLINEIVPAVLFAYFAYKWGWQLWSIRLAGLTLILLAVSTIDAREQIIPDVLIVTGILWWILTTWLLHLSFLKGFAGGVVLGILVWLTAVIMDRVLNRESLGGGDIKLFFMTGLYVTINFAFWHLILSACTGLLIYSIKGHKGQNEEELAFGPAIAISTMVCLLTEPIFVRFFSSFN